MKVSIIAALTADGYIGRSADHLSDWTGGEDKKVFVRLTKEAGVIVMGSRTFATIGHALPGRRNIVYSHNPSTINDDDVEVTQETPTELVGRLQREGHKAVAITGGSSIYDLYMRSGMVTDIYITYVPVLFGTGLTLFTDQLSQKLQLADTTQLPDGSVLMHYTISR